MGIIRVSSGNVVLFQGYFLFFAIRDVKMSQSSEDIKLTQAVSNKQAMRGIRSPCKVTGQRPRTFVGDSDSSQSKDCGCVSRVGHLRNAAFFAS
ncbi:MAG TPA: hypothetical protein VM260_10190, partial [Pirellula sp.]|nr:hypothetical protein [Pirellula sp.]